MTETREKRAVEAIPYAFEYSETAPFGATLVSATVTAKDKQTNANVTSTLLVSGTAVVVGSQARFRVRDGAIGKRYIVTCVASFSDNSVLSDDLEIHII